MQMNDMMITISMKTFEEMADRIEVLENTPSPEAIVRAALDPYIIADALGRIRSDATPSSNLILAYEIARSLASNPAEVAAIIKKAGDGNKERSDEEGRG
jgi:hypothetical protein